MTQQQRQWRHSSVSVVFRGLIQKEKVDIVGDKGAKISIVVKKNCSLRITPHYGNEVQMSYTFHILFYIFLLCSYYVTDMIRKLELSLLIVFTDSSNFTDDWIWLRPNRCIQNWCTDVKNWTGFTHCSGVSVVDFEQVIADRKDIFRECEQILSYLQIY